MSAVAAGAAGDLGTLAATNAVGSTVDGEYGTLTLNADGTYSYSFLNTDAVITGETIHDVFHYQISDGHGGYDDATLTINIAGTDLDLTITPAPADPHDSDPFVAQRGHDIVQGVAGGETFIGGTGNDQLYGNGGNDTFLSGVVHLTDAPHDGFDIYDGGANTDTVDYSSTTAGVTVDLTPIDRSSEAVLGTNAVGSDPTTMGELLLLGAVAGGYTATTATGRADGAEIDTDALLNIENVIGGSGGDTITGDGNVNILHGAEGIDTIHGAGGNDFVYGDGGNDVVAGDAGNDYVNGGAGNDTIIGGAGYDVLDGSDDTDTVDYSATTLGVTVALTALNRDGEAVTSPDGAGGNPDTIGEMLVAAGAAVAVPTGLSVGRADGSEIGTDALINIENATGGSGDDTILGNEIKNVLKGNGGIDHIWGEGGRRRDPRRRRQRRARRRLRNRRRGLRQRHPLWRRRRRPTLRRRRQRYPVGRHRLRPVRRRQRQRHALLRGRRRERHRLGRRPTATRSSSCRASARTRSRTSSPSARRSRTRSTCRPSSASPSPA